jgi:hypothetical protein
MRFRQFLEDEDQKKDAHILDGLTHIKQECGDFLDLLRQLRRSDNSIDGDFLYRGMKLPVVDRAMYTPARNNRPPRDSSTDFNIMFNAAVELAFGIDMIRTHATFCHMSWNATINYGNTYYVFPKGPFKMLCADKIDDSYSEEDKLWRKIAEDLQLEYDGAQLHISNAQNTMSICFGKIVDQFGHYNIDKAVEAVLHDDKVLEAAFEEYQINEEKITADQVRDAMKNAFEELYSTDPEEALRTQSEILLYNCEGYWIIPRKGLIDMIADDESLDGQSPDEFLENFFFPKDEE